MIDLWHDLLRAAPIAGMLAIQLAVLLVALPLWLRRLDRWRWRSVRGSLVETALAAHVANAEHAATLSRQLFRHNAAAPLARLSAVREAMAAQRAAQAGLAHRASMFAAAIDPALAGPLAAAIDFGGRVTATLETLTRLYLKEAQVELASSVVHGRDALGYGDRQPVALAYAESLVAAAGEAARGAAANRVRLERAMPRRLRRARSAALDHADALWTALATDAARFVAGLQPVDPDSVEYRTRGGGGGVRTLDGLIARFDRGGTLG